MKTRILIFMIIVGFTFISSSSVNLSNNRFFYAYGKKVELVEKPNTLIIKYNDEVEKLQAEEFLKEISPQAKLKWHGSEMIEIICENENSKNALKYLLLDMDKIKFCIPFYTTIEGADMGVTDEILIAFNPGVSTDEQETLHKKFDAKVEKTTKIYQKLIVPKCFIVAQVFSHYKTFY